MLVKIGKISINFDDFFPIFRIQFDQPNYNNI